ncbi:hypothetical protein E8E15_000930 [Penicillium rubens]|nr:hypothetical protein E8E15_000930 [Penicillium rubens]
MCASVVDSAILDKLCDAANQIPSFWHSERSQIVRAGIMLVRKGEIIGSMGSAHCFPVQPHGPYQVISHKNTIQGELIYYTLSRKTLDPGDTIISCSAFNPGIHVWYVNVVQEPLHSQNFDLKNGFLIERQEFNIGGERGGDLHGAWVTLSNGRLHCGSGDYHHLFHDPMVFDKIRYKAVIGGLYLVGAMNHTREAAKLAYYL